MGDVAMVNVVNNPQISIFYGNSHGVVNKELHKLFFYGKVCPEHPTEAPIAFCDFLNRYFRFIVINRRPHDFRICAGSRNE